jgi:ATP-dependent Lon protease
MADQLKLPVLPLRETVVFPGAAVPISAGRPGTVDAIERALQGDRRLFAVAQRENQDEVEAEMLYGVGTIVQIAQVQRGSGGMQLLIHGVRRATAVRYVPVEEGLALEAVLEELPDLGPESPEDAAFQALYTELRERSAELGKRRGIPPEMLQQFMEGVQEPGPFADLVAFYVEMDTAGKQRILEMQGVEERLRLLLVTVERQLALLEAQEEIQAQVQEELGERQREMLLREQLRAIQRELGEDEEGQEVQELRERIDALELAETTREEIERELSRLERTNPQSAEYQVIRTYLEVVAELPWNVRTEDKLELDPAQQILDEDHYGLEDVKDRVLEFLAVRQLAARRAVAEVVGETPEDEKVAETEVAEAKAKATAKGPILLFAGPPGVGKTSIAKSIARALGRKYVRLALGGIRDEADIRGHRRTYVGAMPGRIVQALRQAKSHNPVILLDEVDKLGVSLQGDPSSALLEVLDPAQNHEFTDHYLGVPFDLSEVLFIATANYTQNIPEPLYDRMESVTFRGYTEREKLEIAQRYLLPRQREESGLEEEEFVVSAGAMRNVISEYTREAGVRQLERELGKLARKAARRIAGGRAKRIRVRESDVRRFLGRTRVHPEKAGGEDMVGVATGMYYTPVGGDIMFIEVSAAERVRAEGVKPQDGPAGTLVLTGQLGDVMKESARAALTYARAHAGRYGLDPRKAWSSEIHVHVPAGAIPKDGPSAGVALASAMVSALSGQKVRSDVAMTGEITLTGRVMPIGGVKEKLLGAYRAGLRTVLIPKDNEPDLEDLPQEVLKAMDVRLVESIDQALTMTLRDASLHDGELRFGPLPEISEVEGKPRRRGRREPGSGEKRLHGGRGG